MRGSDSKTPPGLPLVAQGHQVGRRLQWLREHFGLTGAEFAQTIGVERTRYAHWEAGRHYLPPAAAIQIFERYGITPNFLYLERIADLPSELRTSWLRWSTDNPNIFD